MERGDLQGWYADPFGVHEERYFSVGQPTKLVRDGPVESYDDPPSAKTSTVATGVDLPALGDDAPAARFVGSLLAGGAVNAPKPKTRRLITLASAAVVILGIGTVVAVTSGGSHARSGGTAVVVTGAEVYKATVGASSADVTSEFSFETGNPNIGATVATTGPFSWVANQGALTTNESGPFTFTIREIIDNDVTYSKASIPDIPANELAKLPGLTGWTETIWTEQAQRRLFDLLSGGFVGLLGSSSGQLSPASILGLLRAEASSVNNLGAQIIDGVPTTHYRAHIPLSRLGSGSPAELQQAEQLLGTDSMSVDYWIDASRLLRQLDFALTIPRTPATPTTTVPGEVTFGLQYPITLSANYRISNYGVPVHVEPPPAKQIASVQHCTATADGFDCQ